VVRVELADVRWADQSFKHFASTPAAEVIQVAGEFTWRVRAAKPTGWSITSRRR
jgi:hypothetical protein